MSFQSRRSGFGVCVVLCQANHTVTISVSVPAIGIWGLRHQSDTEWRSLAFGFSPGDRDLGFASRPPEFLRVDQFVVSVPAIGIWGLRHAIEVPPVEIMSVSVPAIGIWGLRHFFQKSPCFLHHPFQSRRSGFGVCVF